MGYYNIIVEHKPTNPIYYNYNMVCIISFDGNIGSGKSTTLEEYQRYVEKYGGCSGGGYVGGYDGIGLFHGISSIHQICFLDEPVHQWMKICDKEGVNILENLYKDTKAHAFKFQMMAYISRLALLRKAIRDPNIKLIVTERSVETDRHVFAKMLYDVGDISEDEFQIYTMWFDEFLDEVKLSGIVYVHASPDVCVERIKHRARPGEIIHADYITRCHEYHESWINNKTCPLLVLPANKDVIKTPDLLKDRMEQITHFINSMMTT